MRWVWVVVVMGCEGFAERFVTSTRSSDPVDAGNCGEVVITDMRKKGISEKTITKVCFEDPPMHSVGPVDPAARGSFVIDRVWNESGTPTAMVTYTNTTQTTFMHGVTIGCTGLTKAKTKVDYRTRSFFDPVAPGFVGTVKVPLSMNGEPVDSAECSIVRAQ